jgi:hypothetical protein
MFRDLATVRAERDGMMCGPSRPALVLPWRREAVRREHYSIRTEITFPPDRPGDHRSDPVSGPPAASAFLHAGDNGENAGASSQGRPIPIPKDFLSVIADRLLSFVPSWNLAPRFDVSFGRSGISEKIL